MKQLHLRIFVLLTAGVVCLSSCTSKETIEPPNLSAAEKVVGLFKGSGSYLPGGLSLGNTVVCTTPAKDYRTLFETGNATINILKLTDSTVTINLTSGPFPQDSYSPVKLTENGSAIIFSLGNLFSAGFFDTNTKAISFSARAPNFSYTFLRNCQNGMPYYSSTSVILFPNPDQIGHFTIKRYEFGGTKQ